MREAGAEVRDQVQQTAAQAAPWVERLARFGYAAKGVVYACVYAFVQARYRRISAT